MKTLYVIIFLVLSNMLCAQNLTIPETVSYINKKLAENPWVDWATYRYSIMLDHNGKLFVTHSQKFNNESEKIYCTSFLISDVTITSDCIANNTSKACLSNILFNAYNLDDMKNDIIFFSNNNEKCMSTEIIQSDHEQDRDYLSCFHCIKVTDLTRESLCNAFVHLFNSVLADKSYSFVDESKANDPFASKSNVNKSYQKTNNISSTNNKTIIQLIKNPDGTYQVPVEINNVLRINFIYDSGASEVSISPDIALTLIRTGTITDADWLESKTYQFADGSTAKNSRFIIKSFKIKNLEIKNVAASISGSIDAPMLLGQNVLSKLGKITIDNKKNQLIIER